MSKVVNTAMICAIALLIAIFIWPTPYRYYYYANRPIPNVFSLLVVRTTRFTGHSTLTTSSGELGERQDYSRPFSLDTAR